MKTSIWNRPIRGLLSTAVVLGLTTAGLASGFTNAAHATEDPRNRDYSIQFRSLETMVNMYDEWNYPAAYFYRNDIQKGANYSYSPD